MIDITLRNDIHQLSEMLHQKDIYLNRCHFGL